MCVFYKIFYLSLGRARKILRGVGWSFLGYRANAGAEPKYTQKFRVSLPPPHTHTTPPGARGPRQFRCHNSLKRFLSGMSFQVFKRFESSSLTILLVGFRVVSPRTV